MTIEIPRRIMMAHGSKRSDHQEWLLDEALKETFPASDPSSPYQLQDTANEPRDVRAHGLEASSLRRGSTSMLWLIAAGCAIFGAGYLLGRIRR